MTLSRNHDPVIQDNPCRKKGLGNEMSIVGSNVITN